jgi:hypothetical protein
MIINSQNDNNGFVDQKLLDIATGSYESAEEWKKAREENKELIAKMKINGNGTESWVCKNCGAIIVIDINGNRAKMKVGKNTKVFVKFTEMAAWCEKCNTFNDITLSCVIDDINNEFFTKDFIRGKSEIKNDSKSTDKELEIDKYLLGLK